MMRYLLTIIFISGIMYSLDLQNIKSQINNEHKKISKQKKIKKQINVKLYQLEKIISKEEKQYYKNNAQLKTLSKIVKKNKNKLQKSNKKLAKLELDLKKQARVMYKTEQDIIDMIVDSNNIELYLKFNSSRNDYKSFINTVLYKELMKKSSNSLQKINAKYMTLLRQKQIKIKNKNELLEYISKQNKKKRLYVNKKKNKKNLINSLNKKYKRYKIKLQNMVSKQSKANELLSSLNILKKKAVAKNKRIQDKKIASIKNGINIKVKNKRKSLGNVLVAKYRGKKTMSPLKKPYKIIRKFGTYYDLVYNIELFNESVYLKSGKKNATVRNILNGKVVYAKNDSKLLGNVVIMKHSGGLHTIYSHLDKISSPVKIGRWIKKGFVIGKVSDTFQFKATKNNKFINPLQLF